MAYRDPSKTAQINRQREAHYKKEGLVLATGDFNNPAPERKEKVERAIQLSKGALLELDDENTREAQKKIKDPLTDEIPALNEDLQPVTAGVLLQTDALSDPTLKATGDIDDKDIESNKRKSIPGAAEPVKIPLDWEELAWNDIRALAKAFTDQPVTNKDIAKGIISDEIARREAADTMKSSTDESSRNEDDPANLTNDPQTPKPEGGSE